jgi:FkbM family methyltransferase
LGTIAAVGVYWQEPEIQLLTSLLSQLEDKTVIDVGAERGGFAEQLLEGGAGRVHVIEPEPSNVKSLRGRFDGDPRVSVHACAISDVDGAVELRKSVSPSGEPLSYGHTVLERPDTDEIAWRGMVSVPGRSLASLVEAGELPSRVGILKIDTEGHDLVVLSGIGPLECDVVMVEHWTDLPHSLGPCPWSTEEMLSALRPRGFSHFVLVVHRGEVALLKWDDADVPLGQFGNLVFLHDRVVEHVWPVVVECATACAESAIEQLEERLNEVETDRQARLEVIRLLTGKPG